VKRRKLVLGNWKMNGTRAQARAWSAAAASLSATLGNVDIGVMPSFVHLGDVLEATSSTSLWIGAQNVAAHANGAYTGEVSASMLADLGVRAVLVGHSERRHVLGDDEQIVADKLRQALASGLAPVLCVGESLIEREADATETVVLRQLHTALTGLQGSALSNLVIAYEPVWAIGTGRTATPEQVQSVHALIRSAIREHDAMLPGLIRILYGGSVKGSNAAQLFAQADVDGGLIGGASLVPEEFAAICLAANQDG
jgi:triosephosphate isomerase (TIM)